MTHLITISANMKQIHFSTFASVLVFVLSLTNVAGAEIKVALNQEEHGVNGSTWIDRRTGLLYRKFNN